MKIKCTADNYSETHSFAIGKTYEIIKDLKGYKIINNGGTVWCSGRQSEEIVLSELRDYYGFEVVPEVTTYELHITCNDGKTTNAVYKVNGKIEKRTEAVCCPSDTFDFATGAQTAFDRVFPKAQPTQPEQDKPKFKVGDKAKIIGNTGIRHYVTVGDIVQINEINSDYVLVTPTHEVDCWGCQQIDFADIEPYAEPSLMVTREMLVKLGACTGGISTFDRLFPSSNGALEDVCTKAEKDGHEDYSEWLSLRKDRIAEMQNEPDKEPEPVYYSGKVVCVESKAGFLTKGKVYTFKNGLSADDVGDEFPFTGERIENVNQLSNRVTGKFIPYLGEA